MPEETTNPPIKTPSPVKINKKAIFASAGVITVIVIGIIVALAVSNNQKNNSSNTNPDTHTGTGFIYLPDNTCPDTIFEENGQSRADLNGDPYIISDSQKTWITTNCPKFNDNRPADDNQGSTNNQNNNQNTEENEPPLLLGSIGFNLADYDPATQTAGDIHFTRVPLQFNQIYGPFGQQDPRSPNDPTKRNPQPTVILPLGTKVHSLVTGEVVELKELYSGDMTLWVAKDKNSKYFYETEHIKNPTVKIGDKVIAGQIIGEVSDYDSHNNPGFGLVEIGILHSSNGGVPEHVCPLQYLDPSIKSTIESQLIKLYSAWNEYMGTQIYNYTTFETPGCVVTTSVGG